MGARIANVAFDCTDALRTATFWSSVLDRPVDAGGNAGFATIGGTDPARTEPAWYFNQVPEQKRAKNRVHVDLTDGDYPSAVDRLVGLGASVVARHRAGSHRWTTMRDPEGNEFCIAARPYTG